ncbi:MAG: alpha/beta hydrolase [Pseudomonadota bacterium]|nr:alpha/beta hydrolase [Pseudomonadota bacterium]
MLRFFVIYFLFLSLILPVQAKEIKIKNRDLILNANLNLVSGKSLADGVVLMAHGTLAHKDMEIMQSLQTLLLERGVNNLAFNFSYGQTDRHGMNNCEGPHRQRVSDDFKEFMIWINWLKDNGVGPITLLGHSRGGNQVARYIIKSPDSLVQNAVLVAPGTWKLGKDSSDYKKRYNKNLIPILRRAEALIKVGQGNALLKNVDFMYCPQTIVSANTFVDYYKSNPDRDTPSILSRSKVPVLVVAASDDKIVPNLSDKMKPYISPNVRLAIVQDAGHFFLDLFAEDLADVILEYIQETIKR